MNIDKPEEVSDECKKALDKFMAMPIAPDDPYWSLFNITKSMNDIIVQAVQYGFKNGYEARGNNEKSI